MTTDASDKSEGESQKISFVNITYEKVAKAMNEALNKNLSETRIRFQKFQSSGTEFKFGRFANFLFHEDGKYDKPDPGYPSDEKTWKQDTEQFNARDADRIVALVTERLTYKSDDPITFEVCGHDGDTSVLFFKENPGDRIVIYCRR